MGYKGRIKVKHQQREKRKRRRKKLAAKGESLNNYFFGKTYVGPHKAPAS